MATQKLTINIKTDTSEVETGLEQLKALLPGMDFSDRQRLQLLLDRPEFVKELFAVQVQLGSAATQDLLVRLEPTDRFLMLLSAVTAGDFDRFPVKE